MQNVNHSGSVATISLNQRVMNLFRIVSFYRSHDEGDLHAISLLRHECYLREGAISPIENGLMEDKYDHAENSYNIAVQIDGKIVSAIRVSVLTLKNPHSPSMQSFPDIIEPLLQQGLTLIDPTRFVVCAQAARLYPELAYVTLKIPFAAADYFDADVALASVRKEHMGFYVKFLRYKPQAEAREYLQLKKPLALMTSSFREEAQHVDRNYPFFRRDNERFRPLFGPARGEHRAEVKLRIG